MTVGLFTFLILTFISLFFLLSPSSLQLLLVALILYFTLCQLLNCSYLNPQILPFSRSPPYPAAEWVGQWVWVVLSCQLVLCCVNTHFGTQHEPLRVEIRIDPTRTCENKFVVSIHCIGLTITSHNSDWFGLRVIALVLRAVLCSTLLSAWVPCLGFIAFEVWVKVIILLYFVMWLVIW